MSGSKFAPFHYSQQPDEARSCICHYSTPKQKHKYYHLYIHDLCFDIYIRRGLYLHLIADVNYKGVRDGVESEPSVVVEGLEAGDLVLEEESDEVRVGVAG